jgi:hypothetical protein
MHAKGELNSESDLVLASFSWKTKDSKEILESREREVLFKAHSSVLTDD